MELKGREDFKESVDTLFDEDATDNGTGEYFDMRSALLASNDEEEEEDE